MARKRNRLNNVRSESVLDRLAGTHGSLRGAIADLRITSLHVWGALLFTIVCILPVTWGVYPIPYHLGYVSPQDVISRVSFDWKDEKAEEQEIKNIEENFSRRYNQVSKWNWVPEVSTDAWNLIERADQTTDKDDLISFAKENNIAITDQQASVMVGSLKGSEDRIDPFLHIITPMQEVLRREIFRLGLMDSERYQIERGKSIRIIDVDGGERPPVRVSRNDPLSPIDFAEVPRILDEGFARMPVGIEFRKVLRDILLKKMTPSLIFDKEGSERELEDLKARVRIKQNVKAGETILLENGEVVTPGILKKLRVEDAEYRLTQGFAGIARRFAGKAVLIMLVCLGFAASLSAMKNKNTDRRNIFAVVSVAMLLVVFSHLLIYYGAVAAPIPVGILAGLAALLLGVPAALAVVTAFGLVVMIIFEGHAEVTLSTLASGWLFACLIPRIRYRLGYVSSSVTAGLLAAAIVVGWGAASGADISFHSEFFEMMVGGDLVGRGVLTLLVWFITGLVMLAIFPALERFFNITTNVRLHELQDQDNPLLRQLVMEAPGTYHHSVIVGTLAEAAAQSVGANALLAKVGSYYHDIGKLMKPEYFSENESGVSRHDHLKPSMSSLIIVAHVKDGGEMAREVGLPPAIIDIIEQHHGDSLVSFFLHRARKGAAEGEKVSESSFKYSGPAPTSREAGLVMLADSVEAATRSLEDPNPAQIRKLVHDVATAKLMSRQLDNSGLTLTDLAKVEDTFLRVLTSMFHSRVKYPGQDKEGAKRRR
ncbi:MAG: HDIG domain-containing protein [Planctomycetes bacterium]|nr:HDIG domain-containing protein [Planctomycetota bacterium]